MSGFFLCRVYFECAMVKWYRLLMITENDVNIFVSYVFWNENCYPLTIEPPIIVYICLHIILHVHAFDLF